MYTELGLENMTELIIYAKIHGFSKDGVGEFFGSVEYLSEWSFLTDKNVRKHLNSLVKRGLLLKRKCPGYTDHYRVNPDFLPCISTPTHPDFNRTPRSKQPDTPVKLTDNINRYKNSKITDREKSAGSKNSEILQAGGDPELPPSLSSSRSQFSVIKPALPVDQPFVIPDSFVGHDDLSGKRDLEPSAQNENAGTVSPKPAETFSRDEAMHPAKQDAVNRLETIRKYWNDAGGLIPCRKIIFTDDEYKKMLPVIAVYSTRTICQAIKNYAAITKKPEEYLVKDGTPITFVNFITRWVERFTDEAEPFTRFRIGNTRSIGNPVRKEEPTGSPIYKGDPSMPNKSLKEYMAECAAEEKAQKLKEVING